MVRPAAAMAAYCRGIGGPLLRAIAEDLGVDRAKCFWICLEGDDNNEEKWTLFIDYPNPMGWSPPECYTRVMKIMNDHGIEGLDVTDITFRRPYGAHDVYPA